MADQKLEFLVRANTTDFQHGLRRASDELNSFGSSAQTANLKGETASGSFAKSLVSLKSVVGGVSMVFGGLTLAKGLMDGVSAAYSFQESWQKINVILRNTPKSEVDDLKGKILALNPALGSAKDLTDALYQAISSGVTDPQNALKLVENAAVAAAGGFTTIETALKSGAAVLNAYGMDVDESRKIFDVMSKTVDLGVISFEQLASSLGTVIPIAAANKVSFEEVSASVASLTLAGVGGSEAVTSMRAVLTSIISPSKLAQEAASKLGIEWNAEALEAKGLSGMLGQLAGNSKVTAKDISDLTGRVEATNAVMALTSEQGMRNLNSSLGELQNASNGAGASMESFKAQQATLSGELKTLGNYIVKAAESIGSALAPALTGLISIINQTVKGAMELIKSYDNIAIITPEAVSAADKLSRELESQGIVVDKTGKSFEQWSNELIVIDHDLKQAKGTIKAFDEATIKAGKGLDTIVSFTKSAAKVTREYTDEEKKLIDKTYDALHPMNKLAESLQQQMSLGFSKHQLVKLYGDQILTASQKQYELTGEISDGNRELAAIALSFKIAEDRAKGMGEKFSFATDKAEDLSHVLLDMRARVKEVNNEVVISDDVFEDFIDKNDRLANIWLPDVTKEMGGLADATKKNSEKMTELGNVVSTTLTNMTQAIAEKVTKWAGPFQDFAKAALSALMEGLFNPILQALTGVGNAIGNWLTGLLTGKGGGGLISGLGGILGGLFGGGGAAGAGAGVGGAVLGGGLAGAAPVVTGGAAGAGGAAAGGGLFGGLGSIGSSIWGGISTAGSAVWSGLMTVASAIPIWGWAAAGLAALGYGAYKMISGPNSYEAAADEAKRDFGVNLSSDQIQTLFNTMGVPEDKAWPIRKSLLSSPAGLMFMASAAESQNILDTFINRLYNVGTSWGNFDFATPFIEGMQSGNWSALNKAYVDAFSIDEWLNRNVPDWRDRLLVPGYQFGTDYVPRTGTYLLHQGEAVIPADENNGRGSGPTVILNRPVIYGWNDFVGQVRAAGVELVRRRDPAWT